MDTIFHARRSCSHAQYNKHLEIITQIYLHTSHALVTDTIQSFIEKNGWWKIMQITINATRSGWLSDRKILNLNGFIMAYSITLRSAPPLSRTDNEPAVGLWDMRGPPAPHTRIQRTANAPVTDACTAHERTLAHTTPLQLLLIFTKSLGNPTHTGLLLLQLLTGWLSALRSKTQRVFLLLQS